MGWSGMCGSTRGRASMAAIRRPPGGASEVVLFHRPSGSLSLTDVAFDMRVRSRGCDRVRLDMV